MFTLVYNELERVDDVDALVIPCSCDGLVYGISLYTYDSFRSEKQVHEQLCLKNKLQLGRMTVVDIKHPTTRVKCLIDFPVRKSWKIGDGLDTDAIIRGFKDLKKTIIRRKFSSVAIPVKDFFTYNETKNYFEYIQPLLHETFDNMDNVTIQAVVTPFEGYGKNIKLYVERHMDSFEKEITI